MYRHTAMEGTHVSMVIMCWRNAKGKSGVLLVFGLTFTARFLDWFQYKRYISPLV